MLKENKAYDLVTRRRGASTFRRTALVRYRGSVQPLRQLCSDNRLSFKRLSVLRAEDYSAEAEQTGSM
ncbi:MAG: hypothetical protein ACOX4X_00760 [Aminobacterium colombiense]|uniref:hypothetical protein n=1 Tax=Aminobacterium colombiense TaxID=81468 RepID=UPI003D9732AE